MSFLGLRTPAVDALAGQLTQSADQLAAIDGVVLEATALSKIAAVPPGSLAALDSECRAAATTLADRAMQLQAFDPLLPAGISVPETFGLAGSPKHNPNGWLSDAIEHSAWPVPTELAGLLGDLEAILAMELDDFLTVRAHAQDLFPGLDWSSDGCSGPVPSTLSAACLRHDFFWRNARMLRDVWGVPPEVIAEIKASGDAAFGTDMTSLAKPGSVDPGYDPAFDPFIGPLWIDAAVAVVSNASLDPTPWTPPDNFFGSSPPG